MQTTYNKKTRTTKLDPTPINQLINQGSLRTLLEKANDIHLLNQILTTYLPDALKTFYQVANLRDGVLIIHTGTATHATLLRYHIPQLLQTIQKKYAKKSITEIKTCIKL